MDMRVMLQGLTPGVEHSDKTDLGAEVLPVIHKAEQAGLARHPPPAWYVEDGMAEFVRQGAQQQAIVIAGQVGVDRDQGRIRHPAVIILAHPSTGSPRSFVTG
jgi:hypothetical protein